MFQVTKYDHITEFSCYYVPLVIAEQCSVEELEESDIDISHALDERAGFFSHYVLNVSWCPTSCKWNTCAFFKILYVLCAPGIEVVSHYIVTRTSVAGRCGDNVNETVERVSLLCHLHLPLISHV